MAAPVIASSASGSIAAAGDDTFDVAAPSGLSSGNLLLAECGCADDRSFSTPTGWTKKLEFANGTNNRITVFAKVADSGDLAGPYTFNLSAGFGGGHAVVFRITGATSTLTDIVADAGPGAGGSGFTATGANVTTASADNLVVYGVTTNGASSDGPGAPWTEAFDAAPAVGKQLAVYTATQATAATVTGPAISLGFTTWAIGGVAIPAVSGGDTTPPTLSSAATNSAGTVITATLSESGCTADGGGSSGSGGFTLSGTSATVSSWDIGGTTLVLYLSGTIANGDTVTYSYARASTTDDIKDAAGNYLADFSGSSVTNNVPSGDLTAGVASFVSSGTAGIVITATDATDGTAPYTYQWQRNEDGGSYSDISDGGGVSGATTLTITDDSAVSDVLYGYRLEYTDDDSNTVTSNAVTAQVYGGGVLSGAGGGTVFESSVIR